MDLCGGRTGGYPAQKDMFQGECVGSAESRANIMLAPDVVQNQHYGHPGAVAELTGG
jgi:hypothetical protein